MATQPVAIEELVLDPHPVWDRLRGNGPIAWVDALGGWVTLTRELAVEVMRDAVTFTVDDPRFSTAQVVGPSMLSLDGSEQARHRDAFSHGLRPTNIDVEHGPWMESAAVALVDSLLPRRHAEVRSDLAGPWSVSVMARILGLQIDPTAMDSVLGWYRSIVSGVEAVSAGQRLPPRAVVAANELGEAVGVAPFVDASSLTREEVASNTAVFLFGGIETTEATITSVLHHVLTESLLLDTLIDDPLQIENAVDESQRLEPAATRVDRYTTHDVSLGGAGIRRGDLVMVSLAAAGRDPSVFEDPHRFRLNRANVRRHLAYATGPHACIGAHLARREVVAIVSALLRGTAGLRLDQTRSEAPSGLVFRKPQRLTVTWTGERPGTSCASP